MWSRASCRFSCVSCLCIVSELGLRLDEKAGARRQEKCEDSFKEARKRSGNEEETLRGL